PRFFSRAVRRIFGGAAPVQPILAGVPAMAAEQDIPIRTSPPRLEPSIDPVLEPGADTGGSAPEPQPAPPKRRWRRVKRGFLVLLLLAVAGAAALGAYESRTSALQARLF